MKPSDRKPATNAIECPCGWSRKIAPGSVAGDQALLYHRVQVHNDQAAVKSLRVF